MEDDPAFYSKFSKMLEDAIQAFRQKRMADADYLAKVSEIADSIRTRRGAGVPPELQNQEVAQAFFGIVKEVFANHQASGLDVSALGASAAQQIDEIIRGRKIVNWTNNTDVQDQMQNAIEDYLHELEGSGLDLSFDEIDMILEKCLDIARRRYPE